MFGDLYIYLYLVPVSIFQNHGGFSPSRRDGFIVRLELGFFKALPQSYDLNYWSW